MAKPWVEYMDSWEPYLPLVNLLPNKLFDDNGSTWKWIAYVVGIWGWCIFITLI